MQLSGFCAYPSPNSHGMCFMPDWCECTCHKEATDA